ncbi:hypothetical protein GF325_04435 [Candidatus Bathyarchaeota archaeon]|nr:hypothetical protein [Candidatus Bathyarchaeota archaeon]
MMQLRFEKERILLLVTCSMFLVLMTCILDASDLTRVDYIARDKETLNTSEIPQGIIGMWHGSLDSIPDGWALCNGSNGTPDLTGRFIRGTDHMETPGFTGGRMSHNHTYSEVPYHDHQVVDPTHYHEINASQVQVMEGPQPWNVCGTQNDCFTMSNTSMVTVDLAGQLGCETENSTAIPPYIELAFIMKIDPNITVPEGLIMMWFLPTGMIPDGWHYCNGSNGTPNMTGRFSRCVENGIDPGTIGGQKEHYHNYTEVPRHTHSLSDLAHVHRCSYDTLFVMDNPVSHVNSICHPGGTPMLTEPASSGLMLDDTGLDICTTGNASNIPPYSKVAYIMNEKDTSAFPRDVIGLWAGLPVNIPVNYVQCDGILTPVNFSSRFALSTTSISDPGILGGTSEHNHTYTEIPRHSHSITDSTHQHIVEYNQIMVEPGLGVIGRYWYPLGIFTCNTSNEVANVSIVGTGIPVCTTDNSTMLPPFFELAFVQHVNSPPEAQSVSFTSNPTTTDDLVLSYSYFDTEGHPEGLTEILWYKNDTLQVQFNGLHTVPSEWTNKTQEWYCTVRPHDGIEFGAMVESSREIILNSAPSVSGVTLGASPKTTLEDLVLNYTFSDADNDSDHSWIRWYKNSVEQTQFENMTMVSSDWTNKSESWQVVVHPNDGTDWGTTVPSSPVFITNTAPTVDSVEVSPVDPETGDDLILTYDFHDPDGDGDQSWIRWYKDASEQTQFENMTTIPNAWTNLSDGWAAYIRGYDGETMNSTAEISNLITIVNTPPNDFERGYITRCTGR